MKEFSEEERYNYDLTQDSLVLDCGAHFGEFAINLSSKHKCKIISFEPVRKFFDDLAYNTRNSPNISIFNCAVSCFSGLQTIYVKGDLSGFYTSDGNSSERVVCLDIVSIMRDLGSPDIDLLKLNIEGSEYDVLERIIQAEIVNRFKNIQVQFHCIEPLYHRLPKIRELLAKTHKLTYQGPDWMWESWELIK